MLLKNVISQWANNLSIKLFLAVVVVILCIWALIFFARGQPVVYRGTTTALSVIQMADERYEWAIFDDGQADFTEENGLCPSGRAMIIGDPVGKEILVKWLEPGLYFYKVSVYNHLQCGANFKIGMYRVVDVNVVFPGGFSPNGDGVNDRLVFGGLERYPNSSLCVYTRAGQIVYQSRDYQNDWTGTIDLYGIKGSTHVSSGVYYYILIPGGTNCKVKGFIYVGY